MKVPYEIIFIFVWCMLFTIFYPGKINMFPQQTAGGTWRIILKQNLPTCIYVLKAELAALKMKTLTDTAL